MCLATQKGWTKARIGRYLGVSRSRIGQRVTKYQEYAKTDRFPQLTKLFSKQEPAQPDNKLVAFKREDWENREFATQVINQVVNSNGRTR